MYRRTAALLTAMIFVAPTLFAQSEETALRRPAKYHYRQDSPERIKIEKALDSRIEPGTKLQGNIYELAEAISKEYQIPIRINEAALLAADLEREDEVQFRLPTGVTLRQALDVAFATQEPTLEYFIWYDSLIVTTEVDAEEYMETVVYELRDLPSEAMDDWEEIDRLIQDHVGGWVGRGDGDGVMVSFPGGLVVLQTQRRHREILDLLMRLREFNSGPPLTITVQDVPPNSLRGKRLPPEIQRIDTVLNGPVPKGMKDVLDLKELAEFLEEHCQIAVSLDEPGLLMEGVDPDADVYVKELGTLRSALEFAFLDVEGTKIGWYVDKSTIVVTNERQAEEHLTTQFYDLAGISEPLESDRKRLHEMVQYPTSGNWLAYGGGSATISNFPGCLIVSCNAKCHEEVGEILRQLREFSAQQGYPDPPVPTPVYGGNAGFTIPNELE
ncbi:MAG: hypothetical protein R3C18_04915 [Planctomycetaceae bacterium]